MSFFKKLKLAFKDNKRAHAFEMGLKKLYNGDLKEASSYFDEAAHISSELITDVGFMIDLGELNCEEFKETIQILSLQADTSEVLRDYSAGKYGDDEASNRLGKVEKKYSSLLQRLLSQKDEVKNEHRILYRARGLNKVKNMIESQRNLSKARAAKPLIELKEEFGEDIVKAEITKDKITIEEAIDSLKIDTDKFIIKSLYVDGDVPIFVKDAMSKYVNSQISKQRAIEGLESILDFYEEASEEVLGKGWKPLEADTSVLDLSERPISMEEIGLSLSMAINIYENAKKHLNGDKATLRTTYLYGSQVPSYLRELMKEYIENRKTKEQTIESLDTLKNKEILRWNIIKDSVRNEKLDPYLYFLNTAEIFLFQKWIDLSRKISNRNPSIDELLEVQRKAYEECYNANRETFVPIFLGEKRFKNWLDSYISDARKKKDELYKAILPAYHKTVEKLGKNI